MSEGKLAEMKITPDSKTNEPRRWFKSDTIDLVIWFTIDNKFKGFQLSFENSDVRQIVTYNIGGRIRHNSLEEDATDELSNRAAEIGKTANCICKKIADQYKTESAGVDPKINQWILEILTSKH